MADETEEYRKLIKAIKEASDVSTRRYELEKAQAEEIKKLYETRISTERSLKEIIAQNNSILEAEANAATDKEEKEKIDKINQADSLIFQTEKQLKEFGDKLSEENKIAVNGALDQLIRKQET